MEPELTGPLSSSGRTLVFGTSNGGSNPSKGTKIHLYDNSDKWRVDLSSNPPLIERWEASSGWNVYEIGFMDDNRMRKTKLVESLIARARAASL